MSGSPADQGRDPVAEEVRPPSPAPRSGRFRALLAEVQRRRVPRAVVAYGVAMFGLLQGVEVLRAAFEGPRWVLTAATILALAGLPVNVLVAWYFDVVPDAGSARAPVQRAIAAPGTTRTLRKPTWAVIGAMALVAAGLGAWRLWPTPAPPAPPAPRSVLVADFENRTGEPVFESTLEPALTLALEGASFLTSFSRGAALRIAEQLHLDGAGLAEARARLVAQREGIDVVTAGAIERTPAGYRVGVRALDAVTGKVISDGVEEAPSKDAVLAAATKLAARVRAALGDTVPEAVQLSAGETFGAASLEAAHAYAQGMNHQFAGRWDEAGKAYLEALRLDPNLGRAYAGLAVIANNAGRRAEAERYFKEAMARVERMSEREKFRSRGAYYLVVDRDPALAIEALSALVARYPADNAGLANLAVAYQLQRDFPRALAEARRAIEIYPRNVPQRNNVGLFAMYAGQLDEAIREQQKVLELNPGFMNGHVGLALAQLAAGRRAEALATWRRLEALGTAGASVAAEGLADLAAYEGRLADARGLLERGIAADDAAKDAEAAARKRAALAEVLLAAGQRPQALAAALRAVEASATDYVRYAAGMVLADGGDERRARAVADGLDGRIAGEARLYAELLRAALDVHGGRHAAAVERLRAAEQRVDGWLVRAALGRAYLEAGSFARALDELEKAQKRRGEATDVFLDVVPTYRLYAAVEYQLARAQEGLGSSAAAETFQAFLTARSGADDPRVEDARRRLAGR